jgi:hypothetical protein
MKAFTQDLKDFRDAYLIRVGPEAAAYGDPWQYIVTCVSYDGETATLMGFKGDGQLTPAHVRAAATAARSLGYTKVVWERKNHDNNRFVDATRKSGTDTP